MKRNPNLVRALTEDGTEVFVSESFARSHNLRLVDGEPESLTADTAAAEPVSTTIPIHPEGSDSSASTKED